MDKLVSSVAVWIFVALSTGCQKSEALTTNASDANTGAAIVEQPKVTVALEPWSPTDWYMDCGCACCLFDRPINTAILPICVDSDDILKRIFEDENRYASYWNERALALEKARRCGNIGCARTGIAYVTCEPIVPSHAQLLHWVKRVNTEYEKNHKWLPEHGGPPGKWPPRSHYKHKALRSE